ncbi:hypothetical protein HYPSUDRAFT_39761 [Hypholoma sublateritium FD-334 SS-4]|uniref:Uncharacterized protein n=1 Tax=Hypholoma sublateritium (strain FD-334 SS-4) TaxID=945553 RepID=A0A0D2PVJ7_HYPSF|nr:hypothetical protein HYPSUDRAFT_39761 [Hypholoma sublateritium FD-334 SS-4]
MSGQRSQSSNGNSSLPPGNSPGAGSIDSTGILNQLKEKGVKDRFPAASLVAALLQQIGINFTLAPRHVHTVAQVLGRSNKVYEAIVDSMGKFDAATSDALDDCWDLLERYTTAIPVLERILLDLPLFAVSLDSKHAQLPPASSTQEAISYLYAWSAERYQLTDALAALKSEALQNLSPETAKTLLAQYITHRITDDNLMLKALHSFIVKNELVDEDIIKEGTSDKTLLADVKKLTTDICRELAQKPPSEDMSGLAVTVLMMTYTPFAVISKPTTTVEWKTYLKGGKVWLAIKDLLTKVKAHIASLGQISEDDIATVEKILLNLGEITINTAKEMLALIKLAAFIPRPYSGRTAALVKTIYSVDQISRQDKHKAFTEHRYKLKMIMEKSHQELTLVKEAPYDFQTFSLDSSDYQSRRDSIRRMFSGMEALFTVFEISAEWSRHNNAFTKSADIDEKHIKDGKKVLLGKAS